MITDFQILGIAETGDQALIRSAFRRRVKELHPDRCAPADALRNHDLFTAVCQAYERLVAGRERNRAAPDRPAGQTPHRGKLVLHADPAYVFYREGTKAFMKIHPSSWNLDTGRMLNTKIAGQEDEQSLIAARVMEIVKLFPKAYYYFSIVVHEYPASEWAFDAQAKMDTIEERIVRYRRIIESFRSWNRDEAEEMKKYNETYSRMNQNIRAVRRDETGWKDGGSPGSGRSPGRPGSGKS